MKIKIDKKKELVSVLNISDIDIEEKNKIIDLMNKLELFANKDSAKITYEYIQKNNIIFEKLINSGIKDLYYNISMIGGSDRLHYYIKDAVVDKPIVSW